MTTVPTTAFGKLRRFVVRTRRGLALGVLWLATYVFARLAIEGDAIEGHARLVVALAPAVPFSLFLVWMIEGLRRLDELERRIQLEALALAFPGAVIFLMTLGLIGLIYDVAGFMSRVWVVVMLLYFAAHAVVTRRYA
jgi:hypothetical protein